MNNFITFSRFETKEAALNLGKLLEQNSIEYALEDDSIAFDVTFANSELNNQFLIKLRKEDFAKADVLLTEISAQEITTIPSDYYLLEFTKEELVDVISKPDEWSKYDFLLAQRLLKERGIELDESKIESLKAQRNLELSQPDKANPFLIDLGYILAFLGGAAGLFIGWHLFSRKKIIPNGDVVYGFTPSDRKHGNRILLIGIFSILFWLSIGFLFFDELNYMN